MPYPHGKPIWYINSYKGSQWTIDSTNRASVPDEYKIAIITLAENEPVNLRILFKQLGPIIRAQGLRPNYREYAKALRWAIAGGYLVPINPDHLEIYTPYFEGDYGETNPDLDDLDENLVVDMGEWDSDIIRSRFGQVYNAKDF
jgi:hypothetical protein